GGAARARGSQEATGRRQAAIELINRLLEPLNLLVADAKRRRSRGRALRPAEVRPHVEQVVLNVAENIADIRVLHVELGDADHRVRLVDAAVGNDADVVLRQTRSVAK